MTRHNGTVRTVFLGACLSLFLAPSVGAEQAGDPAAVKKHVALAKAAAGDDLKRVLTNCNRIGKPLFIPKERVDGLLKTVMARGRFKPARVFDNLYFVGAKWVSAWAIKTDDGIILIDSLNNDREAREYIEGGLRELGLDPASIKKVIVTHAHGDHYGGAKYLQEKFGARVHMSAADWQELAKPVLQYDSPLWGRPPKKDVTVSDGEKVTLGKTAVTIHLTPGHTPGTISVTFPVKDGGTTHRAVLWGGNGFNFGAKPARFVQYIKSAQRIRDLAKTQGIDIFLSNHAGLDATGPKLDALKARAKGAPHPFVVGVGTVQRAMTALAECGKGSLANFDAKAVPK